MDEALSFLGFAFKVIAGNSFYAVGAPAGTHIGKHLGSVGKELEEEHTCTVECIVFGSESIGLSYAVPVKGSVEDGFCKVRVGPVICPLPLTLEAAHYGVVAYHLFLTVCGQVGVAVHKVLDNAGGFNGELPVLLFFFGSFADYIRVFIPALGAVFLGPFKGFLKLFFIINSLFHTAENFNLVNAFNSHSEIFLKEFGVDNGAGYTHADRAYLQVGFAFHCGNCHGCSCKAEQFFSYIVGDCGIIRILHIFAVDAEGGQAFLRVGSQHGGKVNGAWPFGCIKAPYALNSVGVHIHCFRAVAPAGCNGKGNVNALFFEFGGAGGGLCHSAYRGIRNNNLYGLAVGVFDILSEKVRGGLGHIHSLVLNGFSNFEHASSCVNNGAYAYYGIFAYKSAFCHFTFLPFTLF